MRESWRLMEQFEQIAKCPTWAGDLISKQDTARLRAAGLIRWKNPPVKRAGGDAYRMGANVLTWRGRVVWYFWRKLGQ